LGLRPRLHAAATSVAEKCLTFNFQFTIVNFTFSIIRFSNTCRRGHGDVDNTETFREFRYGEALSLGFPSRWRASGLDARARETLVLTMGCLALAVPAWKAGRQ